MSDRGLVASITITMKKHPASLKVAAELQHHCDESLRSGAAVCVYEGPVRALCPLAPNNVNTIAVAAIAAHTLGFDGVRARLIADPSCVECCLCRSRCC